MMKSPTENPESTHSCDLQPRVMEPQITRDQGLVSGRLEIPGPGSLEGRDGPRV
jgi:hypothetical protein